MLKMKLLLSYLLFRNYHIESHINESSIVNRLIYECSKGLEKCEWKYACENACTRKPPRERLRAQVSASLLGNAWERKQTQALSGTQVHTLKEINV